MFDLQVSTIMHVPNDMCESSYVNIVNLSATTHVNNM